MLFQKTIPMKNMIICGLLLCLLAGFGGLNAQEAVVSRTPAPSEPVMKEFAKNYADVENPVWYTYQDNNGQNIYFATFTRNGDQNGCITRTTATPTSLRRCRRNIARAKSRT